MPAATLVTIICTILLITTQYEQVVVVFLYLLQFATVFVVLIYAAADLMVWPKVQMICTVYYSTFVHYISMFACAKPWYKSLASLRSASCWPACAVKLSYIKYFILVFSFFICFVDRAERFGIVNKTRTLNQNGFMFIQAVLLRCWRLSST